MEVLQRTANRGSISTGPYQIDNSLKFERSSNEAVETTNQAGGNRKTWTFSAWIKRTALSEDYHTIFGAEYTNIQIMANDRPRLVLYNGTSYYADPEMLMRDTSAWYHIVVQLDTTQSTAADRVKWWINGERVTTFNNSTYTNMTQNTDFSGVGQPSSYGSGGYLRLGRFFSGDEGFDGYMADVYYLNGTAAEADDFGEYDDDSGIWVPKAYTGSGYGTQGFHYKFDNASNLGEDSSGEGHDANSFSNIAAADQATDTPTNNFATINVLWGNDRMPLISEGATVIGHNANSYKYAPATMGVANGKWYWEIKPTVNGNTLVSGAGIASNQGTLFFYEITGNFVYHYDGDRYVNGGASSYGAAWATNDIIGFAYDADNWTLTAYVNNSSQGNLLASQTDISSELFIPYVYSFGTHTYQTNFGGYTTMSNTHTNTDANGYGSFVYAPPSGYYALCTKNLAEHG